MEIFGIAQISRRGEPSLALSPSALTSIQSEDESSSSETPRLPFPVEPKWQPPMGQLAGEREFLSELHKNSKIKLNFAKLKLSREEIRDKVKGALWGQAIGDAIGLATENMSKDAAATLYEHIISEKGLL